MIVLQILVILGLYVDFSKYTYPVFMLEATTHDEASINNKLFSTSQIEHFLYVKIPAEVTKRFGLYQVSEIRDTAEVLSDENLWEHDPNRVWYRFRSDKLNMTAGYHQYRLSFVNLFTNETCELFMSYTIQDNSPDKPYYYMENANRSYKGNG